MTNKSAVSKKKRVEWLKSYDQIEERYHISDLRRILFRFAHQGIRWGARELAERISRVQFVFGHHVLDDEIESFKKSIEWLKKKYKVVSYTEAVNQVLEGPIEETTICLSFDDGLKNCLRIGRILAEYDISACFFVCPGIIGCEDFSRLQEFADRLSLPTSRVLTWEDIEELQLLGHEIGGHTYGHRDLAQLPRSRVEEEVGQTFETLATRVDPPVHFAWPYGRFRHFTEYAAGLVFREGFASCASGVRGCHSKVHKGPHSTLCIRRTHFVAGRPLRNTEVFLTLNALTPWRQRNGWPSEWEVSF